MLRTVCGAKGALADRRQRPAALTIVASRRRVPSSRRRSRPRALRAPGLPESPSRAWFAVPLTPCKREPPPRGAFACPRPQGAVAEGFAEAPRAQGRRPAFCLRGSARRRRAMSQSGGKRAFGLQHAASGIVGFRRPLFRPPITLTSDFSRPRKSRSNRTCWGQPPAQ